MKILDSPLVPTPPLWTLFKIQEQILIPIRFQIESEEAAAEYIGNQAALTTILQLRREAQQHRIYAESQRIYICDLFQVMQRQTTYLTDQLSSLTKENQVLKEKLSVK